MRLTIDSLVALHLNPKKVIDIGGFQGEYAEKMFNRFGCSVVIFEPIKDYADFCRSRFKKNKNITVIQKAVGRTEGMVQISKDRERSSIYAKFPKEIPIETVEQVSLKGYLNTTPDVLKLNCEGAEYDILEDIAEYIPKIPDILVQFHRIEGYDRRIGESINLLAKTHELVYTVKWDLWRRYEI